MPEERLEEAKPEIQSESDSTINLATDASGNVVISDLVTSGRQPQQQQQQQQQQLPKNPRGYALECQVGRGGMSVVYRAKHLLLNKPAAVKMLHSHMVGDEHALKRFQQEARSVSKLQHKGIITVHDFGLTEGDNTPYLCMDLVDGSSLAELLKKETFAPKRALVLCAKICDALKHAHEMGVIHRDIKPSNVLLANAGTHEEDTRIVDFGIAKLLQNETTQQMTKTGESIGSPPYMSPEQVQGLQPDARSDIYSLGCLLYELITGKPPLRGANAYETIHMQLHELPRSIHELKPDIVNANALDALILKALAKNPAHRYQSMAEMLEAINTLLPFIDETPDPLTSLRQKSQVLAAHLHNRPQLLIGLCLVVLVIPVVVAWSFHSREVALINQKEKNEITIHSGQDEAQLSLREAQRLMDEKQYAKAEPKLLQAAESAADQVGITSSLYHDCLQLLEQNYRFLGRTVDADKVAEQLTEISKFGILSADAGTNGRRMSELMASGLTHPDDAKVNEELGPLMNSQAWAYDRNSDYRQAEHIASDALTFNNKVFGPNHKNTIDSMIILAHLYGREMRDKEAEKLDLQALELSKKYLGDSVWEVVQCELELGNLYNFRMFGSVMDGNKAYSTAYYRAGARWLQQARDDARKLFNGDSPWLGEADEMLASLYKMGSTNFDIDNRLAESESIARDGYRIESRLTGPESFRAGVMLGLIADIHAQQAKKLPPAEREKMLAQADSEVEHCLRIIQKTQVGESLRIAQALNRRAMIHEYMDDPVGWEKYANAGFACSRRWSFDPNNDVAKHAYASLMRLYQKQGRKADITRLMAQVQPAGKPKGN